MTAEVFVPDREQRSLADSNGPPRCDTTEPAATPMVALCRGIAARQHALWRQIPRRLLQLSYRNTEGHLYTFDLRNGRRPPPGLRRPMKDHFADLEMVAPAMPWRSRRRFLNTTESRLRRGEHVYTYADSQRLLHYAWIAAPMLESCPTELRQKIRFDRPVAILYDAYTTPTMRGRKLYQHCVAAILEDLSASSDIGQVVALAVADNAQACRVLEKSGFEHHRTYYCTSVCGVPVTRGSKSVAVDR
jgi:GNAT superfamily N-acetyltransferase